MNEEKYEKAFRAMVDFENAQHERNQRRIKAGIWCLVVIPIVFLVLMFLTSSSKPVFLILWIISLYGIGVYLIGVEYIDHKLQHQLAKFRGEESVEAKPLIGSEIDTMEGVLREAHAQAKHLLRHEEVHSLPGETEKEPKEEAFEILDLNESSEEKEASGQEEADEEHI